MTEIRAEDGLEICMETTDRTKKSAHVGTAVLTGQSVLLRPVGAADLPILQIWDADPEIIALMGRRFGEQSADDWFRGLKKQRTVLAWIVEAGGRPVGEVELAQINYRNGTAEIRICIGEKECWSRGFGSDALIHSLGHAFEGLNLKAIYLRVFATNARAIRLYERLGFRKEAILPPSTRRQDPAPVVLMNLSRQRWRLRQQRAVAAG